MPGIMVDTEQKDSNVGDDVQCKRGVPKYPIAHGDNGTGMCKAESAGDDWLSDELQIDPIIDEPREMTSPPVLEPMSFAQGASHATVVSQDTPPQVTDCGGLLVSSFVTRRPSTLSPSTSLKQFRDGQALCHL